MQAPAFSPRDSGGFVRISLDFFLRILYNAVRGIIRNILFFDQAKEPI